MKDKLVITKTKVNGDDKHNDCDACCLDNCDDGYNYTLSEEEPVKIQTEYEWKKERCESLAKTHKMIGSNFSNEYINLGKWLEDNKPTNFIPCTRENTKVGDFVRYSVSGDKHEVKYIHNKDDRFILAHCNHLDSSGFSDIRDYEIDLNNTEE